MTPPHPAVRVAPALLVAPPVRRPAARTPRSDGTLRRSAVVFHRSRGRGSMPSLRIEVAGQSVVARLPDGPVRVGRDASCDLRIDDPEVSAGHFSIEPLPGGGHKLTDLNTGRPTKVNGYVVKRVSLKPGDVIEVGPARIVYDPDAAPSTGAAPGPATV